MFFSKSREYTNRNKRVEVIAHAAKSLRWSVKQLLKCPFKELNNSPHSKKYGITEYIEFFINNISRSFRIRCLASVHVIKGVAHIMYNENALTRFWHKWRSIEDGIQRSRNSARCTIHDDVITFKRWTVIVWFLCELEHEAGVYWFICLLCLDLKIVFYHNL